MLDTERTDTPDSSTDAGSGDGSTPARPRRRRAASRPAGAPTGPPATTTTPTTTTPTPTTPTPTTPTPTTPIATSTEPEPEPAPAPVKKAAAKRTRKKATAPAAAAPPAAEPTVEAPAEPALTGPALTETPESSVAAAVDAPAVDAPPAKKTAKKAAAKRTRKKATAPSAAPDPVAVPLEELDVPPVEVSAEEVETDESAAIAAAAEAAAATAPPGLVLFQAPEPVAAPTRRRRTRKGAAAAEDGEPAAVQTPVESPVDSPVDSPVGAAAEEPADDAGTGVDEEGDEGEGTGTRRRRRGGRGRRGRGRGAGEDPTETGEPGEEAADEAERTPSADAEEAADEGDDGTEGGTRRRRRRRRRGGDGDTPAEAPDDPPNTVVRVREPRKKAARADEDGDGVRSIKGSTRLEAKKQRRREGRDAGRRRPSIITEAEFLARREAVKRSMVVRQTGQRTQIAVLEDGVLVEHYVSSASSSGLVGNVYLGKVQNVLPSMEAAFVDVGKGRNAVLYAGEVNWDAAGLEGQPKRIEQALKSGDAVLVQVTKDPIGHKGARLTSQVSLAGRYLVLVPGGTMTGISRKLPDTERSRLKAILKKVVPEGAGVIVRTAAEGASEEELERDVTRLTAQWEDIERKAAKETAPALLYGEPDLTIRVVRDVFNEDFSELVVSGEQAWDLLEPYVGHVAPDLAERMSRWEGDDDVFAAQRIDEQLAKALDRKVWLPSGGYLIIDRTEAMVVIDVNTGKFTGAGGNLEETVTKNNLEAAEEIVRQLRLRDLGGMIVVDFIDMVLESNRELVLRRLTECLGRDRTKHQVAEVTSLGLVQMTRKRVGQGLHEAFAETCEHCNGRGFHIRTEPVEARSGGSGSSSSGIDAGGERKSGGRKKKADKPDKPAAEAAPRPKFPMPPPKSMQPAGEEEPTDAAASPVAVEDPVEAASGSRLATELASELAGELASDPATEPATEPSTTPAVTADAAADAAPDGGGDEDGELVGAAPAPRARRRRRATG